MRTATCLQQFACILYSEQTRSKFMLIFFLGLSLGTCIGVIVVGLCFSTRDAGPGLTLPTESQRLKYHKLPVG
jgi:hypothetical protein